MLNRIRRMFSPAPQPTTSARIRSVGPALRSGTPEAVSRTESYKNKTFLIADPDTRLRNPDNLMDFVRYTAADTLPPGAQVGNFKCIPQNTEVKVDKIKVVPMGANASIVFAHVLAKDGGAELGWASTRNFKGKFVNETLGAVAPAPGADKFGPCAAWSRGEFLKQITLVEIVDSKLEIERIAVDTLDPYLDMVAAAEKEGIQVAINSGFRSYPQQKFLFEGFKNGLPGFNLAAKPGHSNHQNGIAFDIAVAGGTGNPCYDWLTKNAAGRGFVRTVNGEPWHWEHDKTKAAAAVAAHTFKTGNVVT